MPDQDTVATAETTETSGAADGEAPVTYEVKTADGTVNLTLDELKGGYGHTQAAEAKMREAATIRKTAQEDTRVSALVERMMKKDDPEAMRELAIMHGKSPEAIDAVLNALQGGSGTTDNTEDASGTDQQYAPVGLDDLSPELQQEIQAGRQARATLQQTSMEAERSRIFDATQEKIDSDPVLGTIRDEGVRKLLSKHAKDLVQARVGLQGASWPGVLEPMIPELRAIYGNASNRDPAYGSDGVSGSSGIGPAAAMASGPDMAKPVESVPMSDPRYQKIATQRLQQKLRKLMRKPGV